MKKMIMLLSAVVVAINLVPAIPAKASVSDMIQTSQTMQKTIEVSGEGIVNVKPDLATIYMTVETFGETAEYAQDENNKITDKVEKALKSLGVKDEDMITTYFSVDPKREYNSDTKKWEQDGYKTFNRFSVKIHDVDNVGKYIDTATKSGVTSIGSVYFSVEDPNAHYKQALQASIKNANSSATALAEAINSQIDSCISVKELSSYNSYNKEDAVYSSSDIMSFDGAVMNDSSSDIHYDNIDISANVIVTYTFK